MKPHKHCEIIKAWADGHEIQVKCDDGVWRTIEPNWNLYWKYRIKPRTVTKVGWVNIGSYSCGLVVLSYGEVYASREEALACAKRIGTITAKVEWTEEVE